MSVGLLFCACIVFGYCLLALFCVVFGFSFCVRWQCLYMFCCIVIVFVGFAVVRELCCYCFCLFLLCVFCFNLFVPAGFSVAVCCVWFWACCFLNACLGLLVLICQFGLCVLFVFNVFVSSDVVCVCWFVVRCIVSAGVVCVCVALLFHCLLGRCLCVFRFLAVCLLVLCVRFCLLVM